MSPVPGEAGFRNTLPAPNLPKDVCGIGAAAQRHRADIALRIVRCFRYRIGHLIGLSQANTDMPIAIANGDDGIEAEAATALYALSATRLTATSLSLRLSSAERIFDAIDR